MKIELYGNLLSSNNKGHGYKYYDHKTEHRLERSMDLYARYCDTYNDVAEAEQALTCRHVPRDWIRPTAAEQADRQSRGHGRTPQPEVPSETLDSANHASHSRAWGAGGSITPYTVSSDSAVSLRPALDFRICFTDGEDSACPSKKPHHTTEFLTATTEDSSLKDQRVCEK